MEAARSGGICSEGFLTMKHTHSLGELVDYYVANPDWCMERDYPSLDVLREHFAHIESKGVFVDKHFKGELLNERQAYIFHNCRGTIKVGLNVDKSLIPMLYVGNGCRLCIVGTGEVRSRRKAMSVRVPVYIFGKNDVTARSNDYVTFVKYKNERE